MVFTYRIQCNCADTVYHKFQICHKARKINPQSRTGNESDNNS